MRNDRMKNKLFVWHLMSLEFSRYFSTFLLFLLWSFGRRQLYVTQTKNRLNFNKMCTSLGTEKRMNFSANLWLLLLVWYMCCFSRVFLHISITRCRMPASSDQNAPACVLRTKENGLILYILQFLKMFKLSQPIMNGIGSRVLSDPCLCSSYCRNFRLTGLY